METITFTPTQFHLLSLIARSMGLTVEEYIAENLTRLFKALADLKGISPAPLVEAEQVTVIPPAGITAHAAPAAAPVRKSAPTTGLLELFGGDEEDGNPADTDTIIHP